MLKKTLPITAVFLISGFIFIQTRPDKHESAPTTTLLPATTTIPPTTTTSTSVQVAIRTVANDIDGDGIEDKVIVTNQGPSLLVSVWFSSQKPQQFKILDTSVPEPPNSLASNPLLGVIDIDQDGKSEVVIETNEGASTQSFRIYQFKAGALEAITIDNHPAQLSLGGTVTHFAKIGCINDTNRYKGRELVEIEYSVNDQSKLTLTRNFYRLSNGMLMKYRTDVVNGSGDNFASLPDGTDGTNCGLTAK